MIELVLSFFSSPMRLPLRKHARQVAVLAFMVLLIFSLVTTTQAEEEGDIVTDAQVSLEQMAQSTESQVQSHRAELANLKEKLRQLEAAQRDLQAQINPKYGTRAVAADEPGSDRRP
jgi:uncharacterized protein YlxW (UPF0749 family)